MSYVKSDYRIAKKRKAIRAKSGGKPFELYVKKTNQYVYAVVYDCAQKRDVHCVSSAKFADLKSKSDKLAAYTVGKGVAEWCVKNDVKSVYFNKLGYKFHGKLAEVVRGFNEVLGDVI